MKYGLIGEKLGHSFSAEIHRRLGGYAYELKELGRGELATFMADRDFEGINVTIPYKEEVIPYLDYVDDTARSIGAVNTVVNRNGHLYGYNTDFFGLRALIEYSGFALQNKTVLILGSGGTSKTAAAVAESLGCRKAVRVSRTAREGCITYEQAAAHYADAEILINTTPCGMYPHRGESAVNLADYPSLQAVVDVVFNPLRTKLVCDALSLGIPAVGGLYMLVAQAACAAEKFTGRAIDPSHLLSVYREVSSNKENLVLIGMPGCGKSTVGQRLARQMGRAFWDTDALIVEGEGPITDIFAAKGEVYFRDAETEMIRRIASQQGCVIATGGGAILRPENIQALKENGRIVFLDRSLERLTATLDRPLSSDRESLRKRFEERYDLYGAACDVRIDADATVEAVVQQCEEVITYVGA